MFWCSKKEKGLIIDEYPDDKYNYISINGYDYRVEEVLKKQKNSFIVKAVPNDDGHPSLALKFCNRVFEGEQIPNCKIINRFKREIRALEKAKLSDISNRIIEKVTDQNYQIWTDRYKKSLLFYGMELADMNLREKLSEGIDFSQKLRICYEILLALKKLHDIHIYHRDIKPENILIVKESWKIGDLGLCDDRSEDSIDAENEKIGPFGFISPEAVNKALSIREGISYDIDMSSDIFQLGQLFWYILNGEVPIGIVEPRHSIPVEYEMSEFYTNVIIKMMSYKKIDRGNFEFISRKFQDVLKQYSA